MNKLLFWPFWTAPKFIFSEEVFSEMKTVYQPYSFIGKFLWKLNESFHFLSKIKKTDINYISQLSEVLDLTNYYFICVRSSEMQIIKSTFILICKESMNKKFVLKVGFNQEAINLIKNEHINLNENSKIKKPSIVSYIKKKNYESLKTLYIDGNKELNTSICDYHIAFILELMNEKEIKYSDGLKICFSHGDFCPWNMVIKDNSLILYDWETASFYPLGYDLFTFIFHTTFLIQPSSSEKETLKKNNNTIQQFFEKFDIEDYSPYLKKYIEIRIAKQLEIQEIALLNKYKKLYNWICQ